MNKYSRNIALTIIFMALGIALSPFTSIPAGFAKINPTQHFINILLAVLAGTRWSVGAAAGMAVIRNAMATGTVLAFPGGMIGAFLSGICYKYTKNIYFCIAGEIIGTGIIAPVASSFLIAPFVMGKDIAILALLPSFLLSTVAGSIIAYITILSLKKANVITE